MSDDLPHEALDRLLEVTLVLGADMDAALGALGLTGARAGVVWTLHAQGPVRQRRLAEALDVSPRNVTGLVDGLVQTGFVTREADPTDRRAALVTLTEEGAATAARLVADQRELAGQLFGDVADEDLRAFALRLSDVTGRIRRLIGQQGR